MFSGDMFFEVFVSFVRLIAQVTGVRARLEMNVQDMTLQ